MRPALLDKLACPQCRGVLECRATSVAGDGNIVTATLECLGCHRSYPVERGIPRFVPSENYASSFGYQWNRFRREQIDSLNGTRQSEHRLRSETDWAPEWLKGKWILDAGCGAGRFLEVASRTQEAQVVGVDISNAVDAAQETLGARSNVHFVQASIFQLPFRPGGFDGVYCIGVIQHTPDPSEAVRQVVTMVADDGKLALTIYERRRFTKLYSKYLIRPFTRRLPQEQLLRLITFVMPVAFAVCEVLFRLPLVGRVFRFVIPVADYVDDPDLSLRQRYRWALMDTFDMLAPAYDIPQRERDVVPLLARCGVAGVRRLSNPGLNLVGTKMAAAAVGPGTALHRAGTAGTRS